VSSDQRWTGGIANREWQRGVKAVPVVDIEAITRHVRAYLRDVERHRQILSPDNHPTLRSCLKVVYGPETAIRDAYAKAVT
jgi:hypothetical protein